MSDEVVVHERRRRLRWWQSRVVWLNIAAFLIAAVAVLQQSPLFAQYGDVFSLVVALLNLALRIFVTSQPIDRGQP